MDFVHYLKIIRPFNLLIIFLTQILFYTFIIYPVIEQCCYPILAWSGLIGIGLCTALMGAGSYVINDICDNQIDLINKPQNTFISSETATVKATLYYRLIVLSTTLLAIALALYLNKLYLIWIFPLCIILLHVYSTRFKKQGIIGNIIVSVFCAFVIGILLISEAGSLQLLSNTNPSTYIMVIQKSVAYMLFAFWLNLIREIVKDMEDIEGDRLINSKSIPITWGLNRTKILVQFLLIAINIATVLWVLITPLNKLAGILLIIIPNLVLLVYSFQIKEKANFTVLSKMIKFTMLFGLIYILAL